MSAIDLPMANLTADGAAKSFLEASISALELKKVPFLTITAVAWVP